MLLFQLLWLNEPQYSVSLTAMPMETECFGLIVVSSRHLLSNSPPQKSASTNISTYNSSGGSPIHPASMLAWVWYKQHMTLRRCASQDLLHFCAFVASHVVARKRSGRARREIHISFMRSCPWRTPACQKPGVRDHHVLLWCGVFQETDPSHRRPRS